jgi:hypothetical protein
MVSDGAITRSDLRSMKSIEHQKRLNEFIYKGSTDLKDDILNSAKKGLTQHIIPFKGCHAYSSELVSNGYTIEDCQQLVNGIQRTISGYFPDSDLLYDDTTKIYILKWD